MATSLLERLERIGWTEVVRLPDLGACWEWDGCRKAKGYGKLGHVEGRTRAAHQVSYEAHKGQIPDGLFVLHRCDNPPCINPAHLFAGTKAENNADMAAKGRAVQGARHHSARLTADQVTRIRSLSDAGMSQHEIGRRFGIAQSTARDIALRRSWRSVPELAA
jgi:hypothetical protein